MNFTLMANVHIGKKIKELVKKSGMTRIEFARRINSSRGNLYNIFERQEIDTRLLVKISKVLGHDLSTYYSIEPLQVSEDKNAYSKSEAQQEIAALKKELRELQKNYAFLEKINRLLEEKLEAGKKKKGRK